jgi:hypothetical protein
MISTFTTRVVDSGQFFAVEIIGRKIRILDAQRFLRRDKREELYRIKNRSKSGREA